MKYGKKNEVKLDPLKYNLALIGEGGIGKTTLIKEYCERLAGEDGYLFCEMGKEDGADAITGINYINCPSWDEDYEIVGDRETIGFRTLVDDIVENRTTDWKDLKVVVIDTYDELFAIAEPEVIRMHNRQNPEKTVKSIKAAFGGYQAGEDKAIEIVLGALWDLKSVGVSFITIGHTKTRNLVDPYTGAEYMQLTTNISSRYFNAIKTKVHFLATAYIDRTITKEKTGRKDIKNKDIMKSVVTGQARKITFRDDNFVIDSKSRFADITNESIDFSVDAFIKAIKDAIRIEHDKGKKTMEQSKKEQEEQEAEQLKHIAELEKEKKEKKILNEAITQITEYFKANKGNLEALMPVVSEMKNMGYKTPDEIENMEAAQKILSTIKSIN